MKSDIKKQNERVIVNISQVGNDKNKILKNLNDCKEGKCSCPTNEYEKISNLDIKIDEDFDEIIVDLEPKKDKKIDIQEIQKCLDHTESDLKKNRSQL